MKTLYRILGEPAKNGLWVLRQGFRGSFSRHSRSGVLLRERLGEACDFLVASWGG